MIFNPCLSCQTKGTNIDRFCYLVEYLYPKLTVQNNNNFIKISLHTISSCCLNNLNLKLCPKRVTRVVRTSKRFCSVRASCSPGNTAEHVAPIEIFYKYMSFYECFIKRK